VKAGQTERELRLGRTKKFGFPVAGRRPTLKITIRELARRLGVSHTAILKGIRNGRLQRSIAYDDRGRPFIADAALAAGEWEVNRDPAKIR
jgi:hypothetical protein